jgi:hypothetical protein
MAREPAHNIRLHDASLPNDAARFKQRRQDDPVSASTAGDSNASFRRLFRQS